LRSFSEGDCNRCDVMDDAPALSCNAGVCVVVRRTFAEMELVEVAGASVHSAMDMPIEQLRACQASVRDFDDASTTVQSDSEESTRGASSLAESQSECSTPRATAHSVVSTQHAAASGLAADCYTTLLIKNVPSDCTSESLSAILIAEGLDFCYDFVYVPWNLQKGIANGFAFVNMVSPTIAYYAKQYLDGRRLWNDHAAKLEVRWGNSHQGFRSTDHSLQKQPDHAC